MEIAAAPEFNGPRYTITSGSFSATLALAASAAPSQLRRHGC
jgi:hypothetical protein